jgi:hypothetical protein
MNIFQSMWFIGAKHYKITKILWNSSKNLIYNSWKRNRLPWKKILLTEYILWYMQRSGNYYSYLIDSSIIEYKPTIQVLTGKSLYICPSSIQKCYVLAENDHKRHNIPYLRANLLDVYYLQQHHVGLGGMGKRCPSVRVPDWGALGKCVVENRNSHLRAAVVQSGHTWLAHHMRQLEFHMWTCSLKFYWFFRYKLNCCVSFIPDPCKGKTSF